MAFQKKSLKTCTCDWLKNAADDERFPIEYDEESNEFKLRCDLGEGQRGYTVMHFCPFCGGKAPDIKKERTFSRISEQEFIRLQEITRHIRSIEDAFRILGKPELGKPEPGNPEMGEQELLEAAHSLTYQNISETATIHITEYEQGQVRIVIQEKFLGKRHFG